MRERERTRPSAYREHPAAGHASFQDTAFTQAERRRIFRQMVIAEMEGGVLRYSRRRELQRYAEEIGIPTFDANLLIAEAQYRAKQLEPIALDTSADFLMPLHAPKTEWLPSGYQAAFALLLAAIIDALLIGWLIR